MIMMRKPAWLEALNTQKFFVGCSIHENGKKNEKNICCLDCCNSICPHCLPSHRHHRLLQVRRYVYHDVVRLEDLEKLIDCSNVQCYTINSSKVVFIKKRPQSRHFKGSANICTSCDRCLQEPYIHCSLGCKVDYVLSQNKDLSMYLRKCESLTLSPDFLIPNDVDIGDGEEEEEEEEEGDEEEEEEVNNNENSMDIDIDIDIMRKKTTDLFVCARMTNSVSGEDIATNMSTRRKGIPHRSPLC
ncbi:putative transcription repressor PLATZ family [Dioscorea sansibarensis]